MNGTGPMGSTSTSAQKTAIRGSPFPEEVLQRLVAGRPLVFSIHEVEE
ncbi:MAG: hypothetical protein ACI9TH_004078 [Kiritimatiellia bacterium]|jgi:hypothetical protein